MAPKPRNEVTARQTLRVRMTDAELDDVKASASAQNLDVSAYVRHRLDHSCAELTCA